MESGALSGEDFTEWSKDFVVFCHITSQVKEDKYPELLSQKGGGGFPYFVFLDETGVVLSKVVYPKRGQDFDMKWFKGSAGNAAREAKDLQWKLDDLKKKAAAGDMDAKVEYFEIRMDLGWLDLKEARADMKTLRLTKAQREDFEEKLLNMEVMEILEGVTRDKKTQIEAGKKFEAMQKAGRIPTAADAIGNFWSLLLSYAESGKDVALYEKGLNALKEKFGKDRRFRKWFAEREKVLQRLKDVKK